MNRSSRHRDYPLRQARLAQGLTLREVSKLSGVDFGQLSRAERGKSGLSLDAFLRVARVLDLRWRGTEVAAAISPFVEQTRESAA